jgi:hypothetical protein
MSSPLLTQYKAPSRNLLANLDLRLCAFLVISGTVSSLQVGNSDHEWEFAIVARCTEHVIGSQIDLKGWYMACLAIQREELTLKALRQLMTFYRHGVKFISRLAIQWNIQDLPWWNSLSLPSHEIQYRPKAPKNNSSDVPYNLRLLLWSLARGCFSDRSRLRVSEAILQTLQDARIRRVLGLKG